MSARHDETGWLIEWVIDGRAHWWTGPHANGGAAWSTDSHEAIRFARREDAEKCRVGMGLLASIVTDHMWVHSGPPDA